MSRRRRGFSLMEVILSIAILASATVLLGELTRFGMRNAAAARDLTQAQLLCESKLNEIVAGLEPLAAVSDATFDEMFEPDQAWVYKIALDDTVYDEVSRLTKFTVTVRQNLEQSQRPVQFSLTRWLIPAKDAAGTDEASDASGSGSSGSGNSNSGGSGSSGTSSGGSSGASGSGSQSGGT